MTIARPLFISALALILAGGLGACRPDEQGRPLAYDKGVYGGQADEPLSEDVRRSLQQRHSGQRW